MEEDTQLARLYEDQRQRSYEEELEARYERQRIRDLEELAYVLD